MADSKPIPCSIEKWSLFVRAIMPYYSHIILISCHYWHTIMIKYIYILQHWYQIILISKRIMSYHINILHYSTVSIFLLLSYNADTCIISIACHTGNVSWPTDTLYWCYTAMISYDILLCVFIIHMCIHHDNVSFDQTNNTEKKIYFSIICISYKNKYCIVD